MPTAISSITVSSSTVYQMGEPARQAVSGMQYAPSCGSTPQHSNPPRQLVYSHDI